jgi:LacI family transcriptional regulator
MDEGRNLGNRITIEIPQSDAESVETKLDKALSENTNIGAIWISGAKAYLIARYLEQKFRRDIILVGYEVYNTNIEYLRRNFIQYLIAQQPKEQGIKTVNVMFNLLAENSQPMKLEYQKVEIVNSENVRFYVN